MEASSLKPLVEFVAGDHARIEVFAAGKRSTPVSRLLYGQFAEHLYNNVYSGMWAQALRNTGFEPAKYFGSQGQEDLDNRLRWREGFTGLPGQLDSFKNGTAYYWARFGEGDVSYSPSDDRVNSDQSQRMEIKSLSTPEVGIQQAIFLPTHRTGEYEVSLWTKSTCKTLHVAIRTTDGKEIGGADVSDLKPEWQQRKVKFSIKREGIEKGRALLFTIGAKQAGTVYLDQCFLFPADNEKGFDPDIIRYLRDAKMPMLRFPGGNFVSGYHWKEGIGPVDERPMRNNPAWNHEEYNHVGTDEWLAFCDLVGCEALICVNAGNGTPEEAADWVEYCNGDVSTKYGALRAKNGHPKAYGVKYWEVGNELWGDWQVGHCTAEEYAKRYAEFHKAMKARDPNILFIANGQHPGWNGPTIKEDAKILRSMSTHYLVGNGVPAETPAEKAYLGLMAYTVWAEGDIRGMLKQMADGGVPDPKIAITEMMIFTQKRELPGCNSLAEVPFYAGMLNLGIRMDGAIELITRTAIVNHGAGLRKEREFVFAEPVHYASRLYSTQSGRWPVRLRITGPQFRHEELPSLPAVESASYLDAVALLNDDGKELNLLVTNRHPKDALTAEVALSGFKAEPSVAVQTVGGTDYMATNSFENPRAVAIQRSEALARPEGMKHTFPPVSLTCLTFRRK